jgi:DNA polymerase
MNGTAAEIIAKLNREVMVCTKCDLHNSRRNAVPGEGNINAPILFIGEAPGEQEDLQGRPFVGAAGKLLNQLLNSIGLRREEIYITNIVKCRPPANRPPRTDEVSACSTYLDRQMKLIKSRIVCPMGNVALRSFLGKDVAISTAHGKPIANSENRSIFPLYHPAAVLYTAKLRKVLEDDFQKLSKMLLLD